VKRISLYCLETTMTPEERQLLSALADRVKSVPAQQKDPEAEQFLRQLVQERPDTPYILAQTVIMQDFALRNAEGQIEDLRQQLEDMQQHLGDGRQSPQQQRPGSFLGGLFGSGPTPQPASQSGSVPRVNPWGQPSQPQSQPQPPRGYAPEPYPYGGGAAGPTMQPSQTGSFLRSAATTAAGVAGGALLFQGINSLFSGHQGGGLMGGDFAGMTPRDSLSASTVSTGQHAADSTPNQSVDQNGLQEADYDPGNDDDFGDDNSDYA
jgi:hypothetical protein